MKKKDLLKKKDEEIKKLSQLASQFEGLDIEKVREVLKQAEENETKELERKGEWERLKAKMVEQHDVEIQQFKAQ